MTKSTNWLAYTFVGLVFISLAAAFMLFFQNLSIEGTSLGIDLIFYAFEGGGIRYDVVNGLRNPPWSVLVLIPFGYLPDKAAWGLLVYGTLVTLVVSVPRMIRTSAGAHGRAPLPSTVKTFPKRRYWLAVFLLITSYPCLRNIADANLEGLVVAGAALLVFAYREQKPLLLAAGVLLVTAKPQAAALLLVVTGIYVLQTWHPPDWLKTAAAVLVVVIPTFLWRGRDWLDAVQGTYQAGSIIDISLSAALHRTGVVSPPVITLCMGALLVITLGIAWISRPALSREKAGMLLAAMLLLSPYAAGNSVVNVLAIGIIPLFLVNPLAGGLLILMIDLPFLWPRDWLFHYQSYWWTLILILAWAGICWRIFGEYRQRRAGLNQVLTPAPSPYPEEGDLGVR